MDTAGTARTHKVTMSECSVSSRHELALTEEASQDASVLPDKDLFLRNNLKPLDAHAYPSEECSICQVPYLSQSHYKLITLKKSSIQPPQKDERTEAQLRITIRDSAATIESKVRGIFNITRPEENSLVFRDSRFCSFHPSYENFTHGRVFQVRIAPYVPWRAPNSTVPRTKKISSPTMRDSSETSQTSQCSCRAHMYSGRRAFGNGWNRLTCVRSVDAFFTRRT